jgi:hypothetical protein
MKTMNVVIILLIVLALFITGYIFIKKFSPASSTENQPIKYSFPVSRDVPKPKSPSSPTYDLPSANLPESTPEQ